MPASTNNKTPVPTRRIVNGNTRIYGAKSYGRWKLVYADFVTVLMAFFAVAWIFVFDLLSKERRVYDTSCTVAVAHQVEQKLLNEYGPNREHWPLNIDYSENVGGVRFALLDNIEPMFKSGSSQISAFSGPHLDIIAKSANQCLASKIVIEGYTDSAQYAGGENAAYTNWELSVDRAAATRRQLLSRGILSARIESVTGYGDSRPVLPKDPTNQRNRRVSVTILAPYKLAQGWVEVTSSKE